MWLAVAVFVEALNININRDGCRAPMQWQPIENAGFSAPGTETWLPVNDGYQNVNVSSEWEQPDSLINNYHRLLHIRRKHSALHCGSLEINPRERKDPQLLSYLRRGEENTILVLINFGSKRISWENNSACQNVIFQTGNIHQKGDRDIKLGPFSAVIMSD